MTDKLNQLIDAKIVSGQHPLRGDIRQGIREIAEEFAASEVGRFLDCISKHSEICGQWEFNTLDGFEWVHDDFIEESGMEGYEFASKGSDKPSLLEYVGFSE